MKEDIIAKILGSIIANKTLRNPLIKKFDSMLHKSIVEDDQNDLKAVQEKKYEFLMAMLYQALKNMDAEKAIKDPNYEKILSEFDNELKSLTQDIWEKEYLDSK